MRDLERLASAAALREAPPGVADTSGLEILDRLLLAQTAFHRCDDAWDLLDAAGLVTAVLCPRKKHVSIAPVTPRVAPARVDRLMPYGEKVEAKITADNLEEGLALIHDLVEATAGATQAAPRRSRVDADGLAFAGSMLQTQLYVNQRPRPPRTNGKAERFIQTLLGGWAYTRIYASSAERARALPVWLNHYNYVRPHASLGKQPPSSRLNNVFRNYI